MHNAIEAARSNLEALRRNPYPGRLIVIGQADTGELVQVYVIMGRGANSRNRVFKKDGGRLWTAAADPSKVKDPSLIIYTAMAEAGGIYVVTNGDQTDTIMRLDCRGVSFADALFSRIYEPDEENHTPRISGIMSLRCGQLVAQLSVLKKSRFGDGCDRHLFSFDQFAPGLGMCVTTYVTDGEPLPSFQGEPFLLPLDSGFGQKLWDALNEENRISLAVKLIDPVTGVSRIEVINKYEEVGE